MFCVCMCRIDELSCFELDVLHRNLVDECARWKPEKAAVIQFFISSVINFTSYHFIHSLHFFYLCSLCMHSLRCWKGKLAVVPVMCILHLLDYSQTCFPCIIQKSLQSD